MIVPMKYDWLENRLLRPSALILVFSCVLISCVVGLLSWKALEARARAIEQNRSDLKNLAHSLAEHSFQSFQNIELVLASVADRDLYDPPPASQNINRYLRLRRQGLPQVSELGILDKYGNWKNSSLAELPTSNESDKTYFSLHQDVEDAAVQISAPVHLRDSDRWTVIVSRRLNTDHGEFDGVALAAIDLNYFSEYYKTYDVGVNGGISLLRTDGRLLVYSASDKTGADLSSTELFRSGLQASARGSYRLVSPLDGMAKFLAYERTTGYTTVVTVAESEHEVLAKWRSDVWSDSGLALGFLAAVTLIAAALAKQFKERTKVEKQLRDREARYRILAENAGDVVLQFELDGTVKYASPASERVLGWTEVGLLGRRCAELVHPEDQITIERAFAGLRDGSSAQTLTYRTRKFDLSYVWVETHFRRTSTEAGRAAEIVAGLRDVTKRKLLEEELRNVNRKLASLASTDGLTGLPNRRAFDQFLRQHEAEANIAILMIDVDHFKLFNDSFGHLEGDECLRKIATAIDTVVRNANGFAARYGGEEFAAVLPKTSEQTAAAVACAIHASMARLAIAHPAVALQVVTLSIGLAHKIDEVTDAWEVVRDSDIALYKAKRLGRNRTVSASVDSVKDSPDIAVS
jgi:diguanylate cyclase (GGDEF)-like protein/PAS domain S-box-containing protein